ISSPLKITGVVNGNGWTGFEGQVGNVKLLDNSGKELATGVLTATTEWTKLPISFEANIEFEPGMAENGQLVFTNENPSGLPEKNKEYILPIQFSLGK
ncbi:MAG: hypothetical protein NTV36_01090, partial [Candidatus Staskawiczbacteria bacterium]|nr:hypothetical protein [Candidatus Staskawiczbacteria bacterium]